MHAPRARARSCAQTQPPPRRFCFGAVSVSPRTASETAFLEAWFAALPTLSPPGVRWCRGSALSAASCLHNANHQLNFFLFFFDSVLNLASLFLSSASPSQPHSLIL